MSDQQQATPQQAPQQATPTQQAPPDESGRPPADPWSTAGTILMAAAVLACAVILADVAMKGRLLGPLFARLPVPASAAAAPAEAAVMDEAPPTAGQDGAGDGRGRERQ